MSSTAIKISSGLAADARAAAADADRSLTGQIEHWARIGKAFEPLFTAPVIASLKKSGGNLSLIEDEEEKVRVLEVLSKARISPQFSATARELTKTAGPLYEADPGNPSAILQVRADGTRVSGRLIDRVFVPATTG